MTLTQAGINLAVALLSVQYILLFVFMVTDDYFTSKLHALAWFIPGWPVLEYAWRFIRNFMELD